MDNMEEFYRPLAASEETLINPQVGDFCCSMFTADDGFYRAVITKVSSSAVGVRYIDYGNCEEVPLSRIKLLNGSFAELPAQAFNAKLFSSSVEDFETAVVDKEWMAKVVREDEKGVYVVKLLDTSGNPLFSPGSAPQEHTGAVKRLNGFDFFPFRQLNHSWYEWFGKKKLVN